MNSISSWHENLNDTMYVTHKETSTGMKGKPENYLNDEWPPYWLVVLFLIVFVASLPLIKEYIIPFIKSLF